jgi:hypothetical protein
VPATAALIAVPLPLRTPVIDVVNVIAGVVVAFATVPAKPFAETTDTLVTVPEPPPPEQGVLPTLFPEIIYRHWLTVPPITGVTLIWITEGEGGCCAAAGAASSVAARRSRRARITAGLRRRSKAR